MYHTLTLVGHPLAKTFGHVDGGDELLIRLAYVFVLYAKCGYTRCFAISGLALLWGRFGALHSDHQQSNIASGRYRPPSHPYRCEARSIADAQNNAPNRPKPNIYIYALSSSSMCARPSFLSFLIALFNSHPRVRLLPKLHQRQRITKSIHSGHFTAKCAVSARYLAVILSDSAEGRNEFLVRSCHGDLGR